jgi:hypothetical protein
VTVKCAADPGVAEEVELVNAQLAPLGVPIPNPSMLDEAGVRPVSVTATVPDCVTLNVKTTEPPFASAPVNVSVVAGVVDGDVESLNQLQAGVRPRTTATSRVGVHKRRAREDARRMAEV